MEVRSGLQYLRKDVGVVMTHPYDSWSLVKYVYDGDHKMYFDTVIDGTEEECRQHAYDNYTDKEQGTMCLMDWEGREWDV